jgi:hypothetical protein
MKFKGQGQLRHRFHGEYSAVIAIAFESPIVADAALNQLGNTWKLSPNSKAIVWVGNIEQLEVCKHTLGSFGADEKKIDSLAKSIDYGEPFEITISIEVEEQIHLFV